ncbi:MAG: tetratricopeptide repeat protein, partial [Rhodospirillales bacterium]|nr:tetratricopeptide repeat protein [Rhodospirillales bacterium]
MAPENTSEAADAIRRAEQLAVAGDFAGAADLYRAALKHHPLEPDIWNLLGLALLDGGEGDEALQCLEKATMLAPDRAELKIGWGIALQRLG